MDFKIVFIDDNMSEKEPFVQNIRKHYKDADCNHVFQNPDKGLEYVLENLNSKMIVFIDWNFSGHHKKGIDLLKDIVPMPHFVLFRRGGAVGAGYSYENQK